MNRETSFNARQFRSINCSHFGGLFVVGSFRTLKFQHSGESGYHVVFKSAIVGAILLILSYGIVNWNKPWLEPLTPLYDQAFSNTVPLETGATWGLMFVLALVFSIIYNCCLDRKNATLKRLQTYSAPGEQFIYEAFLAETLVQISLRNRKIYIGFVTKTVFGMHREGEVTIVPIKSGYREEQTQRLHITTNYFSLVAENCSSVVNCRAVIPMSEIVSIQNFDLEIHKHFQEEQLKSSA